MYTEISIFVPFPYSPSGHRTGLPLPAGESEPAC